MKVAHTMHDVMAHIHIYKIPLAAVVVPIDRSNTAAAAAADIQ